ncbi:MAG: hypothetical protein E7163_00935 [Firmicutes bacterium]|nr:hypothetical protein [Bacillota bacterium]
MNKLSVEEDIKSITSGEYELEFYKNIELNIDGNVKISSLNNHDLKINLNRDSIVKLESIYLLDKNINIDVNIYDNVVLDYNVLIINNGKNKFNVNLNMLGNNSDVKIKLRTINKNDESNIDINCNGLIECNTKDNKLLEDLKGLIINEGVIKISPNIKVLTNEVEANHLVTIGSFDKAEMFYLKTKGLSNKGAKKLLIESFVTSIIDDINREKIKMEVKNIE